ncbi:uncharacterized protein METZ01_LOCUS101726 [marine metagenome]|uniref:Uncharacterized protein n=1 Tax=marine metagenome TaxID=408172 RepID=A0A381W8R7_9ZZZZ
MPKTDTVAGIGTAGAIAKVLSAEVVEALAIDTADAKARLNEAKEAFANAEAAWLETGNDEYRIGDGRKLTVVRGATRNIDPIVLKELVGRGVWARITERAVVNSLFDAEITGGRIDEGEVAEAISHKDRKPSVRVVG